MAVDSDWRCGRRGRSCWGGAVEKARQIAAGPAQIECRPEDEALQQDLPPKMLSTAGVTVEVNTPTPTKTPTPCVGCAPLTLTPTQDVSISASSYTVSEGFGRGVSVRLSSSARRWCTALSRHCGATFSFR